jgi:hypothetical protein
MEHKSVEEPKEAVHFAALNWRGTIKFRDGDTIQYIILQQEITPECKASEDSKASNDDIHQVLHIHD